MNRVFPGARDGSITETIAHDVDTELFPRADIIFDIHSGGASFDHLPTLLIYPPAEPVQRARYMRLVEAFSAPRAMLMDLLGEDRTVAAMMWASYTVLWAMPGDYLQGSAAPGGIAFVNVIGVSGGFVSPVLIGFVKTTTGSLQAGLFVMVALLGVGAIVMLINKIPQPYAGVFDGQVAEPMP